MILAVDLGTSTGFAYGRGNTLPDVGSLRMPSTGDDVGAFLAFFRDWFVPTIRRLKFEAIRADAERVSDETSPTLDLEPLFVIYEAPILPKAKVAYNPRTKKWEAFEQTNLMTTRKLQSLAGVLELMCADLGVPCYETHLGTMKKELTGNGHAEKSEMLMKARAIGITLSDGPEAHDEADALGAFLVGIRYRRKQFLPFWDRTLWGSSHA